MVCNHEIAMANGFFEKMKAKHQSKNTNQISKFTQTINSGQIVSKECPDTI